MKTRNPSFRRNTAMAMPLAILLPTLGAFPLSAAEHVATFEGALGDWKATKTTSQFDWARRTGGTPSGYTGPSNAHAGEYYLYLETSYGNTPGKIAWLESKNFEEAVSSVSFYYHMYGRHMGTLAVETFDGSAWRPVWRITGQQHASHSSAWTQKRLDLSGRTVEKVRFKGTTGSGYQGDMAIDQVTITTGESPEPPTAASPWSKSGSNIYYADSDGGNVGIGDNAPTADLSVLGNLSRALTGHVMASAGSTRVIGAETVFTEELRVGDSLLIGDAVFVVTGIQSDTALTVDTAPTVSTHNATAYTDSDLLIVETGAEKTALVVDRTGNVGIGTAAPKAKLEVAGGIKVGSETVCDAGKAGTIRYDDAGKAVEFCDGSGWTRVEGPEGARGAQGPRGPRGLQGEREPQGQQGSAATVTAGTGLSSSGTTGSVTLSVDTTRIQQRVTETCSVGQTIREIKADGRVVCGGNVPQNCAWYDGGQWGSHTICPNGKVLAGVCTSGRDDDCSPGNWHRMYCCDLR
uniref:MAM domain-containing protein, meprin/A5/mu n=1 Tax=Candidatus Kentrum sp. LPFa TaxID=2126335 RepID=A0A450WYV1_9GAMM|nr:MAG: MAM domain-containing protein, meprin/A5/mu [Candidatus Kentron sp. LPFa]